MKRKSFIKNSGITAMGMAAFPYILPTGTLFAPTGSRIANHVVFCLFAGGIRNFESIGKAEGNLMPHTLNGAETISKDIAADMDAIPPLNGKPLQNYGTLFKNFRYKSPNTIHYTAHAAAITGVYSPNVQLMKPLNNPSLFEYYRKHSSPQQSALNAWWVSDQAGPFTYLNYSDYPGYGPLYGANMIQPTGFLSSTWANLRNFSANEENSAEQLRNFFNKQFKESLQPLNIHSVENNEDDRYKIDQFIQIASKQLCKDNIDVWQTGNLVNEDILTMFTATEILKQFKPELLVVNMQHSDIGHTSFTKYCNNIRKADFALYQLWQSIQSTPELKDDTILVVAPEFGRNSNPNTIRDSNGRLAIDHTGDENSGKIFCLIAGSPDKVKQGLEVNEATGETIDIVPTISRILGFNNNLPKQLLIGRFLEEAFV
jgi:hypothetical protein